MALTKGFTGTVLDGHGSQIRGSRVIQKTLILEAKRLLMHASLSVNEVGSALGMDDPTYFTRSFKKTTRMTPVEYRKQIREKYQR